MKGRFWTVWTVGTAALALAAMVLFTLLPGRTPAVSAHLPQAASAAPTPGGERRVNINTAGLEELMTLPGIGASKAAAILEYRNSKGPFRYPEDLIQVPGIGEGILEGLIHLVTTGGM